MKRFMPLIKIGAGVAAALIAPKLNVQFGVVVDPDALNAAIILALTATNFREGKKPKQPKPQDAPKS